VDRVQRGDQHRPVFPLPHPARVAGPSADGEIHAHAGVVEVGSYLTQFDRFFGSLSHVSGLLLPHIDHPDSVLWKSFVEENMVTEAGGGPTVTRSPWRSHSIILTLVALALGACGNNRALTVQNMLVEYQENPLGMDVQQPRLSWILSSNQRVVSQTAYRILVADNPESLTDGAGNLWDSGKVPSAQSNNVVYGGESLSSGTTYYWKVQVWNQVDESAWSETGSFHTGLMNPSDWEASWISVEDTLRALDITSSI
jgi:hypothetical protein